MHEKNAHLSLYASIDAAVNKVADMCKLSRGLHRSRHGWSSSNSGGRVVVLQTARQSSARSLLEELDEQRRLSRRAQSCRDARHRRVNSDAKFATGEHGQLQRRRGILL